MECKVWSVECGVWSVKCRAWSVECKVRSVECTVWSVECGVESVECEVWSICAILLAGCRIPAKSDFSSFSISFYFLWWQGQPGGGLRIVTLCGVSDTQTCGEMRVLFVLGQPSAEIARVRWANMWCGEMQNFFARSNRLRRSCVSNAQACGGM